MGEKFVIDERNTKVEFIGRKEPTQVFHTCEKCRLPINFYGRMIPCKHVFCFVCACQSRETDQSCARCGDAVQRIEKCPRGAVFVCRIPSCRRTYLSQRDLTAHIRHRHKQAEQQAQGLQIIITQAQAPPSHAPPPVVHQNPPPVVHQQSGHYGGHGQQSSGSMMYQHGNPQAGGGGGYHQGGPPTGRGGYGPTSSYPQKGPPSGYSQGPPGGHGGGHGQGPPQDHRGPPQDNRGPPQDNRGPPQDHRGAHGAPYGNQRRHNASSAISAGQWGNHR